MVQALGVFSALLAIGYGFGKAGIAGAATGFLAAIGIFSALAVMQAETGTDVAASGPMRTSQRLAGAFAALACCAGAVYGGWHRGWIWAPFGYIGAVLLSLLLFNITRKKGASAEV